MRYEEYGGCDSASESSQSAAGWWQLTRKWQEKSQHTPHFPTAPRPSIDQSAAANVSKHHSYKRHSWTPLAISRTRPDKRNIPGSPPQSRGSRNHPTHREPALRFLRVVKTRDRLHRMRHLRRVSVVDPHPGSVLVGPTIPGEAGPSPSGLVAHRIGNGDRVSKER